MSWFENHKFYLSQDQCDEINKIKREYNDNNLFIFISYFFNKNNDA